MLTSLHLHKKSSEVSVKTRSTPASLSIQGQDTKHTTVKWPISWVYSLFPSVFTAMFTWEKIILLMEYGFQGTNFYFRQTSFIWTVFTDTRAWLFENRLTLIPD